MFMTLSKGLHFDKMEEKYYLKNLEKDLMFYVLMTPPLSWFMS